MDFDERDNLELTALCNALADDTITSDQRSRLLQYLDESTEARRFYVCFMAQEASLCGYASEMQTDAADQPDRGLNRTEAAGLSSRDHRPGSDAKQPPWEENVRKEAVWQFPSEALGEYRKEGKQCREELANKAYLVWRRRFVVGIGSLAAMTAIIVFAWLAPKFPPDSMTTSPSVPVALPEVATIIKSIDAQWRGNDTPLTAGTRLTTAPLFLKQGLVQIAFDKGADVILQAPCDLRLLDAGGMFLGTGTISASVSEQATGFTVHTTQGIVTDYGTEFGVIARRGSTVETHVYRGNVGLRNITTSDPNDSVLVQEGQAAELNTAGNIQNRAFRPRQIVRVMPGRAGFAIPGKRLSLADCITSGNGLGTGIQDYVIDMATARLIQRTSSILNKALAGPLSLAPKSLPYIDYLFIPDSDFGPVQVSSLGHEFTTCPDTTGEGLRYVANQCILRHDYARKIDGLLLNGIRYGTDLHPAISFHANGGITFDLAAIRHAMPGIVVQRFSAQCGISQAIFQDAQSQYEHSNRTLFASFWVLIDGQVRFKTTVKHTQSFGTPIAVELTDEDRFLSLVITDGGDGRDWDWGIFAETGLELELEDQAKEAPGAREKQPE